VTSFRPRVGPGVTRTARTVGILIVAFLLLVTAGVAIFVWLRDRGIAPPVPGQQRCVATADGRSTVLDLDQAHYASIIVGLSVKRGLPPRAATIAMTTVYQETGIRNLGYGDRDSVGLFQQRPSQGWGTKKQLMDPYYATGRFYDALVKVSGWQQRDITEVAQRVQRSGYPEAYREHEPDARVLASALTGRSPGGWTCLERSGHPGKPAAMAKALEKTFGTLTIETTDRSVTIAADSAALAWSYANFAIGNSSHYGVTEAVVAGRHWQTDAFNLPEWATAAQPAGTTQVRITVR
jgi:hypothetical protein